MAAAGTPAIMAVVAKCMRIIVNLRMLRFSILVRSSSAISSAARAALPEWRDTESLTDSGSERDPESVC